MFTGGFGPFEATQLTEALTDVLARSGRQLDNAVLRDVQYRSGDYYAIVEALVRLPGGEAHQAFYGITTAQVPTEAVGYFVTAADTHIFIWQHPADPLLPGLRLAATPAQVREHFAPDRDLTALTAVIYRPLNRAVFRASLAPIAAGGLSDTLFLKVLRSGTAQPVYAMHQLLAAATVPVVEPVTEPISDVLALVGGQGMPLGDYIRAEGAHNRFNCFELIEILDRFPTEVMQRPQQPSWADRYQEFMLAAHRAMPSQRERLTRLGDRFERAHDSIRLGPIVPTHGDLYEAHILVDPITGKIQHLLDVDGAGPGYRVDDYACLVGHLAVLGYNDAQPWGWQSAMLTFQRLAEHAHPRTLAVRAAAVVVSLIPTYQPHADAAARGRAYLTVAEALMDLA
ncbi:phosphotransferase [Enteractinococcus coprophilus]|uniref:Phosphotransferase family enzyme n=1 Tax=Enteractinococcus coprophilus TaxID=1027633 RepID=A0A543A0E3_9MICC|nr:phosphotransferase [Enteractinococcus coprophilus]TQL66061.1 phosphotransferase family enzyme [Enteractinococcus coprophilus]